ncbi:MAG: hypothetical protein RJQ09_17475 [Cyclobacteriaceae bacterium]
MKTATYRLTTIQFTELDKSNDIFYHCQPLSTTFIVENAEIEDYQAVMMKCSFITLSMNEGFKWWVFGYYRDFGCVKDVDLRR